MSLEPKLGVTIYTGYEYSNELFYELILTGLKKFKGRLLEIIFIFNFVVLKVFGL